MLPPLRWLINHHHVAIGPRPGDPPFGCLFLVVKGLKFQTLGGFRYIHTVIISQYVYMKNMYISSYITICIYTVYPYVLYACISLGSILRLFLGTSFNMFWSLPSTTMLVDDASGISLMQHLYKFDAFSTSKFPIWKIFCRPQHPQPFEDSESWDRNTRMCAWILKTSCTSINPWYPSLHVSTKIWPWPESKRTLHCAKILEIISFLT